MNITEYKKKNGTIVYRSSVYLGVDKLTGKKARTTVTANTKKGVKIKAREAINAFVANGYCVKEKPTITTTFKNGESVFSEDRNVFFKEMKVIRFYDASRNVIIYITNSTGLVNGSPKHSITAVPLN